MKQLETERMIITRFTPEMAEQVHLNSLDDENRRFVPDEVFETVEDARETLDFLISCYDGMEGPLVHPMLLKTGRNIGYVQLVPLDEGWEVGYHVAQSYRGKGYATEAVKAFLPAVMAEYKINRVYGICLADNIASCKVMEKCGFEQEFSGEGLYQGKLRQICRYIYR